MKKYIFLLLVALGIGCNNIYGQSIVRWGVGVGFSTNGHISIPIDVQVNRWTFGIAPSVNPNIQIGRTADITNESFMEFQEFGKPKYFSAMITPSVAFEIGKGFGVGVLFGGGVEKVSISGQDGGYFNARSTKSIIDGGGFLQYYFNRFGVRVGYSYQQGCLASFGIKI